MRKYRIIQFAIIIAVLILELLPYGAVLNFAVAPESGGGVNRVTYSYFSMIPFGYANFGPLLTAILTCIIAVLLFLSLTLIKKDMNIAITILSCIALFTSVLPLMYGISGYSVIGLSITCLIGVQTVLGICLYKRTKRA